MSEQQRKTAINNKRKGKKFEADVVNMAKAAELPAQRAWGSNGRAMGQDEVVDVILGYDMDKFQLKVKKDLPKWLGFDEEKVDGVIFKTDRGKPKVMIFLDDYLVLQRVYMMVKKFEKRKEEQLGGMETVPRG
jgi:Holliday junction resolvase